MNMKVFTHAFISGFGSALTLHPNELKSMPILGKSQFSTLPTMSATTRKREARKIRIAISKLMESYDCLDHYVQISVSGDAIDACDRAGSSPEGAGKVADGARKNVRDHTVQYGADASSAVYADHLNGLKDMLSLHCDWKSVSDDLLVTKEMVNREQ